MTTPTRPTPTPETDELIDGLAAIGAKVYEGLQDDGKIGLIEIIAVALQWKKAKAAFTGVAAVPDEILTAGADAHERIAARLAGHLKSMGVTHRTMDIAEEIAAGILFNLRLVQRVRHMPPAAEAVEEGAGSAGSVDGDFAREQLGA